MSLQPYIDRCRLLVDSASPEVRRLLSRIKTSDLYPLFLEKVIEALQRCVDTETYFWVTSGERTWEQQNELYQKGRRGIKGEGIVTTVQAGGSAHNYGVAVDAAFDTDNVKTGLQPSWNMKELRYWADSAVLSGLDAGFYWTGFVDGPHVQLNLRKYGISPGKQLKAAYLKGGKAAVFKLLDSYDWS